MRKWLLKITDYPCLDGKYYTSRIIAIDKIKKNCIQVEFQILEYQQTGRQIKVFLPLPIRPQGLSISLFKSCGFDLKTDDHFCPKDAIGKEIMCKFKQTTNGFEAVSFKPVPNKETNREQ